MGLTHSEQIHVALCDNATTSWDIRVRRQPVVHLVHAGGIPGYGPDPGFPTYIATGSKT